MTKKISAQSIKIVRFLIKPSVSTNITIFYYEKKSTLLRQKPLEAIVNDRHFIKNLCLNDANIVDHLYTNKLTG